MTPPRLALRDVARGTRRMDLLFHDDRLLVVPRGSGGDPFWHPVGTVVAALLLPLLGRRPERLPRGTRALPYGAIRAVRVTERPYGAALLDVDGTAYDVPAANGYRPPWEQSLGPCSGTG